MNYMDTIRQVRDALKPFADKGIPVSHGASKGKDFPRIIWMHGAETTGMHKDNRKAVQVVSGAVYYFTRLEYDPVVDGIQEALTGIAGLGWRLSEVEVSEDGVWFYAWDWEAA